MSLRTRRILLYTLIVIFIGSGTLLVISSIGYNFDPETGHIGETGGIFIKSDTPKISIYLNGEFQKETTRFAGGALLTAIPPGVHILRIEKTGHHPWSKGVSVESTLVTELRDVIIFPESPIVATSTAAEKSLLEATTTSPYNISIEQGELTRRTIIDNRASTTMLARGVNSFTVQNDFVYAVQESGFLAKINLQDGSIQTIGRPGFYLSKKIPVRFVASPQGEAALIDASGGLFIINRDGGVNAVTGEVISVQFDKEGEKLLIQKEHGLEILWRKDNPYQPFQKKDTRETILTLGVPLSDAQWFFEDNAHVVFRADNAIFMTEIDGRGGRNTIELISEPINRLITIPSIPDSIFFKKGASYFKIEI